MKGIGIMLWFSFIAAVMYGVMDYHFRYHYVTVADVAMETPLIGNVSVNNQILRPVRFDRWTGQVQIYLENGIWSDFADWNKEKFQKLQDAAKSLGGGS